ncbi:MAG: HAD hydrolase-like protein [Planctomycetes bacterium]|nr:HAD hydrolase-like protein [Planctomycetota bacterium]
MAAGKSTTSDFRSLARVLTRWACAKRAVGFDVFDTLLRRRVEPERIKDLVAQHLAQRLAERNGHAPDWTLLRHKRRLLEVALGQEAEARGDDHEFRLAEMAERWLAQCSLDDPQGTLARELVAHELNLERTATLPTPGIGETLAALAAQGVRLIFVTDIYLDVDGVWDLLRHHGLAGFFAAGYCSSSNFRTKRSGRLFDEVLQQENLNPADFLFVGDNPFSDVDSPQRRGIDCVLVRDRYERQRRTRLQLLEQLGRKSPFWTGRLAREIVEGRPTHLKASRDHDYKLGVMLAPAFIAFTLNVIEQARRQKLERLFFLSREGLTFLRMYRRVVRAWGLADELPPAVYVGVSRHATFLPSLDGLDLDRLHRLWRQYDRQSLNRLLHNLNLPAEEFRPLAARCGFSDFDAPITDPHTHEPFQAFLADAEVQRRFREHRDRARELLRRYLRGKGFFDVPAAGLVDIGWKGSIQDNLVRAVRGCDDCPVIHGLYFGLVHIAEDDLPGAHKHGFLADTRRGDWIEQVVFRNGPVFEMFSSAPHGGVIGYRPLASRPEQVKPVIKAALVEQQNFRSYAATVLAGVEDYLREYLALAPLLSVDSAALRLCVLDQLRRYILYPTGREARAFLRYSHAESFGVFHTSRYGFQGSWKHILLGGSPFGLPRRLIQTLERQFWPEACLRRTGLPLVNFLWDMIETRFAGRVVP